VSVDGILVHVKYENNCPYKEGMLLQQFMGLIYSFVFVIDFVVPYNVLTYYTIFRYVLFVQVICVVMFAS